MIIISDKYGQLGNQLFLFGHFIAVASEHRFVVANPAFEEYAQYFQATSDDLFCRYPHKTSHIRPTKMRRKLCYSTAKYSTILISKLKLGNRTFRAVVLETEKKYLLDSPEFLNLLKRATALFIRGGLFRDPSNFEKHGDKIRAFFRPLRVIEDDVVSLVKKAREKCELLVGVHIRHGDYKDWRAGRYFYDTPTYVKLMHEVSTLLEGKKVGFLVCSDVVHDRGAFESLNYRFGNNHLIEDMYAFAQCDYLIGPPSTYTMWASFYGKVPLFVIDERDAVPTLKEFKVVTA